MIKVPGNRIGSVGSLSRRSLLTAVSAAVPSLALGQDYSPAPPPPKGAVEVGLWTGFSRTVVPSTTSLVRTSGYAVVGVGGALYRLDPDQALSPRSSAVRAQSSNGLWFILAEPVLTPFMTGAVGDGVADDTDALQAALDTGRSLFLPAATPSYRISRRLELRATGQAVRGEGGLRSKVVQTGVGVQSSVFHAAGLGQNAFSGIYAIPGTNTSSLYDGYGFVITGSPSSSVKDCRVTGHRRGGVALFDSNHCIIEGNWISDSVVAPGPGISASQAGCDIYLGGDCSYNIIRGNQCLKGAGFGIGIQTLTTPAEAAQGKFDHADFNVISNNIVRDQHLYGIFLYIFNGGDSVAHTTVESNTVENITGLIPEEGGAYNYGAGIYIQTAEDTVIRGNQIANTVTRSAKGVRPGLNNVPASIGISGVSNCLVADNAINTSNYWGIAVIQATAKTGQGVIITGNQVQDTQQTSLYLLDVVGATVSNNRFTAAAAGNAHGIFIRQATLRQSQDFIVTGNRVENHGAGIQFDGAPFASATMSDNIVRGSTGYAFLLRAAVTNFHDNQAYPTPNGSGIRIGATVVDGAVVRNVVIGGKIGIELEASGGFVLIEDNNVRGAGTPYYNGQGPSIYRPLADGASPSVRNTRLASNAHQTTIVDLADGVPGQALTLRAEAAFTLRSGRSLRLAGQTDFPMTAGQIVHLIREDAAWLETARQ
jgi:hypothetical protein